MGEYMPNNLDLEILKVILTGVDCPYKICDAINETKKGKDKTNRPNVTIRLNKLSQEGWVVKEEARPKRVSIPEGIVPYVKNLLKSVYGIRLKTSQHNAIKHYKKAIKQKEVK